MKWYKDFWKYIKKKLGLNHYECNFANGSPCIMDSAYEMIKTKHDVTAISLEIWSGTSKLAREITSECKKIKPTKEEMTCNYMLRDYGKLVDMIRVGYKLPKHIALVVAMVSIPHLSKDINMNNVCCACRSIAYTGLEFNINSKGLKSEGDVPLERGKQ